MRPILLSFYGTLMEAKSDVVVIGGGAVGLCAAYYLQQQGRSLTVLDKADVHQGASTGNAGMIVPSHIVPLASPGAVAKGIRWLTNPESPFYIKPRPSLELITWLWRFWRACDEAHVMRSIPVLRDLSLASVELFQELSATSGPGPFGFANTGLLMLHNTEKGQKENLQMAELAEEAGLEIDRLDEEATYRLEPEIRTPIKGSVYFRQDGRVDPDRFVGGLAEFLRRGGTTVQSDITVLGFERRNGSITSVRTTGGTIAAREVVIAAGAWSGKLANMLHLNVPVQPAKGYSITLEAPDHPLRIPLILTDEKLTVTAMSGRIRFAGTLALAGFDATIEPRRIAPIRRLAQLYCPEQMSHSASQIQGWSGYRPCSPDGLPIIGRATPFENLTIATGHGMMGVTLAPITGKLVAEIIAGDRPSVDLLPLRPERFH